jgi:sugar fermentation stimulation protein A
LIRRYKRFLADVRLPDGRTMTVHCPNTGALLGCAEPGFPVWLLQSDNPRRKYVYTWELVEVEPGTLVGINTGRANRLVEEALGKRLVPGVEDYTSLAREVRYGRERSRVDFLLAGDGAPPCYLEVKNVNAAVTDGVALFPDAVTARGARHMRELVGMVEQGARAVVCFCVQRSDVGEVRPADDIDPDYGKALREAVNRGVEAIALRADVNPYAISLQDQVPVVL